MTLPPPEWHATLDSTNSYLLRKFEAAENLQDGYTVCAEHQTKGRGQRSKTWTDTPGKSLLFSVGARPYASLEKQALFSFGLAVTIAETLEKLFEIKSLSIKWPNDLYLEHQKLGGILVENVLRGSRWHLAVAGLGLNLWPQPVADDLKMPPAFLADHTTLPIEAQPLAVQLQKALAAFMTQPLAKDLMERYNGRLYRKGCLQTFETEGSQWKGIVLGALADGRLLVRKGETQYPCVHGFDLWIPEWNHHPLKSF